MNTVTLYRIDPARNMQRYYHLDIQPDLFGSQPLLNPRVWADMKRRQHSTKSREQKKEEDIS